MSQLARWGREAVLLGVASWIFQGLVAAGDLGSFATLKERALNAERSDEQIQAILELVESRDPRAAGVLEQAEAKSDEYRVWIAICTARIDTGRPKERGGKSDRTYLQSWLGASPKHICKELSPVEARLRVLERLADLGDLSILPEIETELLRSDYDGLREGRHEFYVKLAKRIRWASKGVGGFSEALRDMDPDSLRWAIRGLSSSDRSKAMAAMVEFAVERERELSAVLETDLVAEREAYVRRWSQAYSAVIKAIVDFGGADRRRTSRAAIALTSES